MSRVAYNDDCDWTGDLWAGWAKSAIYGKRGQALLRELEQALLEMPVKRLIKDEWAMEGEVCTIGALEAHRKVQEGFSWEEAVQAVVAPHHSEDEDYEGNVLFAMKRIGMTYTLAWEIIEKNDELFDYNTPEQRWEAMLAWVRTHITPKEATHASA